jgi:tetratricopeptide (TPR) repeat protein
MEEAVDLDVGVDQFHAEGIALMQAEDYEGAKLKFRKVHAFETQSDAHQGFSGTFCLAQCEEKLGNVDEANELYLRCGLHIADARARMVSDASLPTTFLGFRLKYGTVTGAYHYAMSLYTSDPKKASRYLKMVVAEENEHQGAAYFALGCILLKSPLAKKKMKAISFIIGANTMDYDSASMFLLQLSAWSRRQIDAPSGYTPYDCALTMFHDDEGEKAIAFLKKNVVKVNAPLAHYTMGLMSISLEAYGKGFSLMLKAADAKYEKTEAFFAKIQSMIA